MKTRTRLGCKKRMLALLLALVMAFCSLISASAEEETPVPAQPGDSKEATVYPKERSGYFTKGFAQVNYVGGNVVGALAETTATSFITRVTALAILEMYNGTGWEIVDLKQQDEKNAQISTAALARVVTPGRYYRCHGIFITNHNHIQTRDEVYTDSIWVPET